MCYNVAHSGCEAGEQVDAKWCVDMQRGLAKLCDRCGRCQIKHTGRCKQCGWTHCMQCVGNGSRCEGCDGGLDYRCDIPHGPWQPKRKVGQRLGRNVHNMGRFFVDRVTKARYREVPDPERLPVDRRIEFQAWVSGWQSAERRENIRRLLEKSDDQLIVATARCSERMILFLPQKLFPENGDRVGFGEKGWWYTPLGIEKVAMCVKCGQNCTMEQFPIEEGTTRTRCDTCAQGRGRYRKSARWMWTGEKQGLVCTLADPRYAGRGEDRSGGDVVMDAGMLRQVLQYTSALAENDMMLWLTTGEMGYALEAEHTELVEERDAREGRETGRWVAPQIEVFLSGLQEGMAQLETGGQREESTL